MNLRNFFGELKRRNVYKVAIAYAVIAWLLVQLGSILFPTFEAPGWVMKVFVAIIAAGFPIALVLAWAFELTPEGIKRTEEVTPHETMTPRTGRKIDFVIIGVFALVIALLLYDRYRPGKTSSSSNARQKSIAILPFENLSEEKANAYFAEGIQDEILTKLAAVRDLKVISRTSTAKYQSKPDNLKKVAQELGVSTILEGAVQRAGDKVRVNVQLIDSNSDAHLWAKSYDRELKDVLEVESEVAEQIADALKANLSPSESHVLAAVRTQNTEAYDLFLRAQYEFHKAESSLAADAYDRADAFYRQTLERDPNFAPAAAGLAYSRLSRHWFVSPLTAQELQEVKSIIDRALALAPDSPEPHFALGVFFYWGHRQYDEALAEFNRTLELQPNNASARQFCGWVYRRRGEWERSIADVRRAQELDPRDAQIPANLGATYSMLRQWKDAEEVGMHALSIDPHNVIAATILAMARLGGPGDVDSALRAFDGIPVGYLSGPGSFQGDVTPIIGMRVYLYVIERRFSEAFQAFRARRELQRSWAFAATFRARCPSRAGRTD